MATQNKEPMKIDSAPHTAVKRIDSMYSHSKQSLSKAHNISGFIPFVNELMIIDQLKQHLQWWLDNQYQTAIPQQFK